LNFGSYETHLALGADHTVPYKADNVKSARANGMSETRAEAAALRRWLNDIALPLWWRVGADRSRGGFYEAIGLDGTPLPRPHRARSIARQAFSYCEAGRLGWTGPWREAAAHALNYFCQYFIAPDHVIHSLVDLDGKPCHADFDLYDQAFGLLALAGGYRAFGQATDWRVKALALRARLNADYAHPLGGFLETESGRLPQRANPHMHLFEAALAWAEIDPDPAWRQMADGLARLCLDKFVDPATGALREFFASDWSPAPGEEGRICEPGHHYEWAFLLHRWARLTGCSTPASACRLAAFADACGVDKSRGVVINAVLAEGTAKDLTARLWAQAERIRAYVSEQRPDYQIAAAIRGLRRFLTTPTPGLWFDQLADDDQFILEPARATSLYHIVGAVAELSERFGGKAECARYAGMHAPITSSSRPASKARREPVPETTESAPRVVYLVTEDWYFMSHRLPMARAARDAGFEIHVATRINRHAAAIEAEGFYPHAIRWQRGSLDPVGLFRVVREVRELYRSLNPALVHHVALQATLAGSLAALGLPIACVNAMTGLGTLFISNDARMRIARALLAPTLRALLNRSRSSVLVQNADDRALMEVIGVDPARIVLIAGSGVDIDALTPQPEPQGPVTAAFVGRLVESKGIRALLAAHQLLGERGRDIRLLIAGIADPANPTSIPPDEIERWRRAHNLAYLGFVDDIAGLWASAHMAVLPSHREGLPLSLLEAAACGRPLIATDVPGCRAIARPGCNGLLVPVDNVGALADAMERLAGDADLRRRYGAASRKLVEREFGAQRVGGDLVALYGRLLQQEGEG
jgi:mannose/cellobiose epimerase-like protein (N-acyl-D-glucosamine 2-epimerase family)/glycosyltransferase involved in cell wall biosynthesis